MLMVWDTEILKDNFDIIFLFTNVPVMAEGDVYVVCHRHG